MISIAIAPVTHTAAARLVGALTGGLRHHARQPLGPAFPRLPFLAIHHSKGSLCSGAAGGELNWRR